MPISNYKGPQRVPLIRIVEVTFTECELIANREDKLDFILGRLQAAGVPAEQVDRHSVEPIKVTRGELYWRHDQQEGTYLFRWTDTLDDNIEDAVIISEKGADFTLEQKCGFTWTQETVNTNTAIGAFDPLVAARVCESGMKAVREIDAIINPLKS